MTKAQEIRRVGIVTKPDAVQARPDLERLVTWLRSRKLLIRLDREAARILRRTGGLDRERLVRNSDLVVVLGGDGTLLSIARAAARSRALILGVNLGSLGFLTDVPRDRLILEVDRAIARKLRVEERMMLEMRIVRNGRVIKRECALNDIVVSKPTMVARAMALTVEVNGRYVTAYKSDGLIVSTPTGSTAYSLSAGGPILDPTLDVLILNPICPHTLTHRPLVLRDSASIDVSLARLDTGVFVTVDGQRGIPVKAGDRVRIIKAPERARLLQAKDRDYFQLLRSKLKWGERLTR